MLTSLPILLAVGTALGFLAGLGVGGGSLLVLWLTLILNMEPQTARTINLLFFLPAAAVSCLLRRKQGTLNLKKILPAAIAGCIAAGVFSFIGLQIDTHSLKKLFGFLLIAAGLREITFHAKSA